MATKRPLRTSLTPELYDKVERYARIWNTSTSQAAMRLIAGGVVMWEALAEALDNPLSSTQTAQNPATHTPGTTQAA